MKATNLEKAEAAAKKLNEDMVYTGNSQFKVIKNPVIKNDYQIVISSARTNVDKDELQFVNALLNKYGTAFNAVTITKADGLGFFSIETIINSKDFDAISFGPTELANYIKQEKEVTIKKQMAQNKIPNAKIETENTDSEKPKNLADHNKEMYFKQIDEQIKYKLAIGINLDISYIVINKEEGSGYTLSILAPKDSLKDYEAYIKPSPFHTIKEGTHIFYDVVPDRIGHLNTLLDQKINVVSVSKWAEQFISDGRDGRVDCYKNDKFEIDKLRNGLALLPPEQQLLAIEDLYQKIIMKNGKDSQGYLRYAPTNKSGLTNTQKEHIKLLKDEYKSIAEKNFNSSDVQNVVETHSKEKNSLMNHHQSSFFTFGETKTTLHFKSKLEEIRGNNSGQPLDNEIELKDRKQSS